MWLFWIVWACVCAPASLRACTHTHTRAPACICAHVHACVCVSVPQYQILLSQLSASLSLVVICLSTSQPSTSPSVSLSFFLSPDFFICVPLLCVPLLAPALSFLLHRLPVLFCFFVFFLPAPLHRCPHHLSLWAIRPPFLLFRITFNLSLHSGWFSPLSPSYNASLIFFFFFFLDFGFDLRNIGEEKQGWWNMTQKLFIEKKVFSFLLLDCKDGFRG